jgi:hypothetical protein
LVDSPCEGGGSSNVPQGTGRDRGNPDCGALGLNGPCGRASFEDEQDYDFANNCGGFQGDPYSHRHKVRKAEYQARRQAIFQPAGAEAPHNPYGRQAMNHIEGLRGGRNNRPRLPNLTVWQGPQGQAPGLHQGVPTPPQAPGLGVPTPPGCCCATSAGASTRWCQRRSGGGSSSPSKWHHKAQSPRLLGHLLCPRMACSHYDRC